MAERINNGYKRLFEIRLLHHYWLDEGGVIFDLIPDKKKRDRRLLSYDIRALVTVLPTLGTGKMLSGLRAVYKDTALGSIVAVPDNVQVPVEATFTFMVTVKNSVMFKYTALTLRKQSISEIYHQPEKKNLPLQK